MPTSIRRWSGSQAPVEERRAPQPVADAVSALVNLGYGQPQAARRDRRRVARRGR